LQTDIAMKKLFGTDGIRGHADEFPLDDATVWTIGSSLARQYRAQASRAPRFVTGRDTRESGARIEAAFHAGATAEGAVCESAGVITTPGVAFVTGRFDFDAGVVISASHNPYEDNGIKIFSPDGRKIGESTELAIEADIHAGTKGNDKPVTAPIQDTQSETFRNAYVDSLANDYEKLSLTGLRIVADCANGAASDLAPVLLRRLGASVSAINDKPDGRNINRDCGSLHLEQLCAAVLDSKADFGVAFDGDADRALFVDEKGSVVDGDATLWIMARHLLAGGGLENRTVVATLMSNIGLELALGSIDIKLVRTAVGDKYVLEELIRSGSELGGEQSGHVIFPRKSLVGDGIRTTLSVLDAVVGSGRPFSESTDGFTRFPQILVNVKVREKRPFDEVEAIVGASDDIQKQLGSTGRLLLRYSGTENLARVMIEGEDQATIERQAHGLAEVIKTSLG
jgi:phosphoglucosamine mutase